MTLRDAVRVRGRSRSQCRVRVGAAMLAVRPALGLVGSCRNRVEREELVSSRPQRWGGRGCGAAPSAPRFPHGGERLWGACGLQAAPPPPRCRAGGGPELSCSPPARFFLAFSVSFRSFFAHRCFPVHTPRVRGEETAPGRPGGLPAPCAARYSCGGGVPAPRTPPVRSFSQPCRPLIQPWLWGLSVG